MKFTPKTFEEAVLRYFAPIAHEHGWQVIHRSEDAFEIPSSHCVMRVSFHQGMHTRSMNVVLTTPRDAFSEPAEIGIWAIAGHNRVKYEYIPWEQTAEGFLQEAEYLANLTKKFCLPYMLGQKSDWEAVREYWRRESEKDLEKIKGYNFPPVVQKRWHLPPPPKSDSGDK